MNQSPSNWFGTGPPRGGVGGWAEEAGWPHDEASKTNAIATRAKWRGTAPGVIQLQVGVKIAAPPVKSDASDNWTRAGPRFPSRISVTEIRLPPASSD